MKVFPTHCYNTQRVTIYSRFIKNSCRKWHFLQLFFINHLVVINSDWFIGYFVGNTTWLIAIGYYLYISFLGYNALPFLKNTVALLYPFALLVIVYTLSLSLGWNFTQGLCWFYKYRVQ
ncbi:protein unc-50 homolog [Notothenia coriiceps]|uniref:Protein unc-50 homolog n=1 Tax=Notothenia coriiceps TaxID=8208 RepID=A0A6I9Q0Y9_9TELE|nr:PREDICTED: protein unc-50 homolog [Notothenia coriiceps]